jgi:predicted DNA-binding transcriptional regulator AlpA
MGFDFLGEKYADRRFLRTRELIELGIVRDRGSLKLWIKKGRFPGPLRVGERGEYYSVDEIEQLLAARAAERPNVK